MENMKDDILNDETRKKLKECQLNLLKEFIRICKKYDLQYFCVGGTALGAVRHSGYIPWDDDIDVALVREDYEKFLSVAQSEMPENYFLQTYDTDPEYILGFAKIRDSNTTFIETSMNKLNINHGIYLDIFPLDGYPKSAFWQKIVWDEKMIFEIYRCAYLQGTETLKLRSKIIYYFLKTVFCFRKKTYPAIWLDKKLQKFKTADCDRIVVYGGAWGKKEISPKQQYGKGKIVSFEGIDVVIPENYDEHLTSRYGDYMKFPPKEQQVPHHYADVIDTDNSYLKYMATPHN